MSIGKIIQPSQMPMPKIGNITSGEFKSVAGGAVQGTPEGFGNLLSDGIKQVDTSIKDYEATATKFANGENVNLHEMVLKGEHADLNLRLMSVIKNKVVDAYKEVMRMGV